MSGCQPLLGIGPVKHRARADLGEHRGVERIGRRRNQHLVAALRHRRERELDALRRARRDDDAIRRHRHAALCALGRDRFACGQDPHRRRVTVVSVAQRPRHRFDHVRRRFESESDRIADVEVPDLPAGRPRPSAPRRRCCGWRRRSRRCDRRQESSTWCAASRRQFIKRVRGLQPIARPIRLDRHLECKSDSPNARSCISCTILAARAPPCAIQEGQMLMIQRLTRMASSLDYRGV